MRKIKNKTIIRILTTTFLALCILMVCGQNVLARDASNYEDYRNSQTGFEAVIEDDALLLNGQFSQVLDAMKPITKYGNVAFYSTFESSYSTARLAEKYYLNTFGETPGVVFVVDMNERMIFIYSNASMYDVVTTSYANSITDNVYKYASRGEYDKCAIKAFEQITRVLQGQKIAQPMKYICNTLIALALALLINYFMVKGFSSTRKPTDSELLEGLFSRQYAKRCDVIMTNQTRRYSPRSSSSGGGGHGGGGGHHGGGGGHHF